MKKTLIFSQRYVSRNGLTYLHRMGRKKLFHNFLLEISFTF